MNATEFLRKSDISTNVPETKGKKADPAPMEKLSSEILNRITGGSSVPCPHYNTVKTRTGFKCLDCGATW